MHRRFVMAEETLRISYEGAAVDAHRIPVEEYASSLLGFAEFVHALQELDTELRAQPSLNVEMKAAAPGSFIADLVIAGGDFWDWAKMALNSDDSNAATNLIGFIGTIGGVFVFIKKYGRKKVAGTKENADGTSTIEFEDGESITAKPVEAKALSDVRTRRAALRFVTPLASLDLESISISSATQETRLDAGAYAAFEASEDVEVLSTEVFESWCEFATVSLREGKRMRFYDGEREWAAEIEDEAFLDAVEQRRIRFENGTEGLLEVRVEKTRPGQRTVTRRFVEHVHRVRHGGDTKTAWEHP